VTADIDRYEAIIDSAFRNQPDSKKQLGNYAQWKANVQTLRAAIPLLHAKVRAYAIL
jgi:hypothetical protein